MKKDIEKQKALAEFMTLPGVGKVFSNDLEGADPQKLYDALCKFQNARVDRCMLYVFRCAVYFTSTTTHNPDLLKWWNWKD